VDVNINTDIQKEIETVGRREKDTEVVCDKRKSERDRDISGQWERKT